MRAILASLLVLACLGSLACAGEAEAPAKPEEPQTQLRYRLWRLPFYAVLGLPRDAIDAPVKGATAIPGFRWVFHGPLFLLNFVTSYACWSFTEEGIGGGFDAWLHLRGTPRKRGKHTPRSMIDRTWRDDFCPNWRTFRVISREPVPQPEKPKAQ